MSKTISITKDLDTYDLRVITMPGVRLLPIIEGCITWRLDLPSWNEALYFAPFQRHAIDPTIDLWPEGYNQCQPLPVETLNDVKRGGMFLLLRLERGGYLALLPLGGPRAMAWMVGGGEFLNVEVSHFGKTAETLDVPLLAYAVGEDPYAACRAVWEVALSHPLMEGCGRLRWNKKYPEALEYLGWCSFEEFKLEIDQATMVGAVHALSKSGVPVRWVLIDDGHVDGGDTIIDTQEGAVVAEHEQLGRRRLRSLKPHSMKFPNGWDTLVAAKSQAGLCWLGVWLNFNGYWDGIDRNAVWPPEFSAVLTAVDEYTALPAEKKGAAATFWEHMLAPLTSAGVDFVKVDNQAGNLRLYAGKVHNAVASSSAVKLALEYATGDRFQGLINCMAHNTVCALNTPVSAVTRCSEDYKKNDRWRAKHHLHNSFGNMLWLSPTVWGDHDMFHSSDFVSAPIMARSKALSGGPIYLSDNPEKVECPLVMRLCDSTGRLLRPLAPAMPLPDCLFVDPYEDDIAYRVGAPLVHGCAAIMAMNLTHPEKRVMGLVSASDLKSVSNMKHDYDELDPMRSARVVAFDILKSHAWELTGSVSFWLDPLEDRFFILSPILKGWGLLGCPEKFLAPSFVTEFICSESECVISVREPQRILLWAEYEIASDSAKLSKLGPKLWAIDFSSKATNCRVFRTAFHI